MGHEKAAVARECLALAANRVGSVAFAAEAVKEIQMAPSSGKKSTTSFKSGAAIAAGLIAVFALGCGGAANAADAGGDKIIVQGASAMAANPASALAGGPHEMAGPAAPGTVANALPFAGLSSSSSMAALPGAALVSTSRPMASQAVVNAMAASRPGENVAMIAGSAMARQAQSGAHMFALEPTSLKNDQSQQLPN